LVVYNSQGLCITRQYVTDAQQEAFFEIADWPAGHYLVRLEWAGGGQQKWLEALGQ
jgi:hypothetical protein